MILPPILEDIIVSDSLVSLIYGIGLLVFLTIRRNRKFEDPQSDVMDALMIRIFIWLQLITSAAVLGGIIIEKMASHTHVLPIIEHVVPKVMQ